MSVNVRPMKPFDLPILTPCLLFVHKLNVRLDTTIIKTLDLLNQTYLSHKTFVKRQRSTYCKVKRVYFCNLSREGGGVVLGRGERRQDRGKKEGRKVEIKFLLINHNCQEKNEGISLYSYLHFKSSQT